MKVFVAGASGALGRRLVPVLVANGHDVVAMTRSPAKTGDLRVLGAEPVVADGLDREAVIEAVVRAEPEVVIHQMTALANIRNFKRFDQEFAVTNRLRTVGTDHLLEAARLAGARRFVAQSFGGWDYERSGGSVKTEADPLDPAPPAAMSQTLAGIRYLEGAVTSNDHVEGIALRYGAFYGPGSMLGEGGDMIDQVRKRRLPIVGDGAGVWSFIHLDDAATATTLSIERGEPGIYNVADDEPAPASVWLPELAAAIGAKPPRRVPVWVGRLAAGEPGVSMFTKIRGISNAKAKRELGWELLYPSWRQGFRSGLGGGAGVGVAQLRGQRTGELGT
jgi:nucleoside-diphosphate-sugar epimerase